MHWAAHGVAGFAGILLGVGLLATCLHTSIAPCPEVTNCHTCTNLLGQAPWAAEKAASVGGAIVVVPLLLWHFISDG